ncbi:ATP-binding protein [Streptomyces sp. JHA26]|uniref:ATP-binding protein n=1 Tax=Streptomyces sp. JHA26 TaxID=1917143 RepID=UPI00098B4EB3|nr:ATP-binding protein [Streptomyces sp. JHA26]
MKQSAAKTLGVAALGAAFAAVGAGAAHAAPQLPDATGTVDSVARALPAEAVSQVAPGAGTVLEQGRQVAGAGLTAAQPVAGQALGGKLADNPADQATGLLGGLPAHTLPAQALPPRTLPAHDLSVNGMSLGD